MRLFTGSADPKMALPTWLFCWPPVSNGVSSPPLPPPLALPSAAEAIAVTLSAGAQSPCFESSGCPLSSRRLSPAIRELLRTSRSRGAFALLNIACAHNCGAIEGIVAADVVTITETILNAMYGPAASLDMHSTAQLWLGLGARLLIVSLKSGGVAIFKPTAGSGRYNPDVIGGGVTKVLLADGPYAGWHLELLKQLREHSASRRLHRECIAGMSSDEVDAAVSSSLCHKGPLELCRLKLHGKL